MERWGRLVYRQRWVVLLGCVLLLGISIVGLKNGGELRNNNTFNFESIRGFDLESTQLPTQAGTSFELVMISPTTTVGTVAFANSVHTALASLQHDPRVAAITLPPLNDPQALSPAISNNRHGIVATVGVVQSNFYTASQQFASLRAEVTTSSLEIHPAGDLALNSEFNTVAQTDLQRAEAVSLPAALILLLLIFGSVVAALLCLVVGLCAIAAGLALTYGISHLTDVSVYAISIVGLIGLGVAIDYSLFIVSRFREELRKGSNTEEALAVTMRTAGRAIIFSGITVAIGVCAMLFYNGSFLASLGYCGAAVVGFAVFYATTLLISLLAILGPNVNRLTVLRFKQKRPDQGIWHRLATAVMAHPWRVLIPCLLFLVAAGSPFPQMRLANSTVAELPPSDDVRQGSDLIAANFSALGQNTIDVVIDFQSGGPFTAANISRAYTLTHRISTITGVVAVDGYVALDGGPTTLGGYQQLYARGLTTVPSAVKNVAEQSVGPSIAVLHAHTDSAVSSDAARNVVRSIRSSDQISGATVSVTGDTPFDIDFVQFMLDHTPAAITFVMVVTYIVLLFLLRSIVLPLKAVVMNLLSLSAAFGAMVFIFQQGHFSSLLDFTPASIDPTLPILLFCIVFGLSMDYEVFLLTRIQEKFREHGDNRLAVAQGLEASGRLVTGAAAIMFAVFAAFALASIVVVKSVGMGMAIAVVVDATVVRALVVPAVMRLLGSANWWAPQWLQRGRL